MSKLRLLLLSLLLCSATVQARPQRLAQGQPLRLCYDLTVPQLFQVPDQFGELHYAGQAVEVIAELTDAIPELQIDIVVMPWGRCQREAQRGKLDGILMLLKNSERARHFWFSEPLLESVSRTFFRKGTAFNWLSLAQLSSLRIASIRGNFINDEFSQAVRYGRFPNLTEVAGATQIFELLKNNHADVVLFEQQAGEELVSQLGLQNQVVVAGPPLATATWRLALRPQVIDSELKEHINQQLRLMTKQGTLARIAQLDKHRLAALALQRANEQAQLSVASGDEQCFADEGASD